MANYLVTGAAGFIGSAISRCLLANHHSVTTIDNLSTGKRSAVPEGCRFIEGNIQDENIIKSLKNELFDAIIHIAGQSSGEISFEKPIYDLQTNAQSTLMLLDFAKRTGCKRFTYASSMSTYGDHPQDPFVSEESATIPKSFYAVGKLASENYMRIYSNSFGLDCIALRFFNVYGAGQNMDNLKQGMASIYLAMALKDKHILVKGSKSRFRDFVHVSDVVDAVLAATNKELKGFNVFNVSTGVATTVEAVINEILKNLPGETVQVEYTAGTPGDQHGIYGDYSKIHRVLGWTPKYDFASGMKDMVRWAQKTMSLG